MLKLTSGKKTAEFKSKVDEIYNVNILEQGKELLVSGSDGLVEIFDIRAGASRIHSTLKDKPIVYGCQSLKTGPYAYVLALQTGECVFLDKDLNPKCRQSISDGVLKSMITDDEFVAFGDSKGFIHVYSHSNGKQPSPSAEDKENSTVTGSEATKTYLKKSSRFRAHQQSVNSLASSSEKQVLVSGSRDGLVHFWDTSKGFEFEANGVGILDQVVCLDVNPKGDLVVAGSWDQNVCVFKV